MKAYRRPQFFLAGFLLFHFCVGITSELAARGEIFPFYSWFLFVLVPQKAVVYDVLILEQPGRVFDPPVSYQRAGELVREPRSIVTYRLVQAFGRATEKGDTNAAAALRTELESRFTASPVHYELAKLRFDNPLRRWKSGQPQRSEVIREFRFQESPLPPAASSP